MAIDRGGSKAACTSQMRRPRTAFDSSTTGQVSVKPSSHIFICHLCAQHAQQAAASVIYILTSPSQVGGHFVTHFGPSVPHAAQKERSFFTRRSSFTIGHLCSACCALLASIALLPLTPLLLSTRGIGHLTLSITLLKLDTLAPFAPVSPLPLTPVSPLPLTLVPLPSAGRQGPNLQKLQTWDVGTGTVNHNNGDQLTMPVGN